MRTYLWIAIGASLLLGCSQADHTPRPEPTPEPAPRPSPVVTPNTTTPVTPTAPAPRTRTAPAPQVQTAPQPAPPPESEAPPQEEVVEAPPETKEPEEPKLPPYLRVLAQRSTATPALPDVRTEAPRTVRIQSNDATQLRITRRGLPLQPRGSIVLRIDGQTFEWTRQHATLDLEFSPSAGWSVVARDGRR